METTPLLHLGFPGNGGHTLAPSTHLGLPGNGGHTADLLGPESVDDGALAHIRVADQPHADLLPVLV